MSYLLDTCAVSDFVKGEPNTLIHLKAVSPESISISSITLMEIRYGMAINPQRIHKIRQVIEDFIVSVRIVPFAEKEMQEAASIRSIMKAQGTPIGAYDILIAATAKANKLILITSNTNEFERVSGLSIENWRE